MVELIEKHHLKGVLTLLDQEEANHLGHTIIEDIDHDPEVSIQSFSNLSNK